MELHPASCGGESMNNRPTGLRAMRDRAAGIGSGRNARETSVTIAKTHGWKDTLRMHGCGNRPTHGFGVLGGVERSEERRVGKECRCRGLACDGESNVGA